MNEFKLRQRKYYEDRKAREAAKEVEVQNLKALLTRAAIVLQGMHDAKPSQAKARFWTYWRQCPELVDELWKAAKAQ
jgi:hypothetical protein